MFSFSKNRNSKLRHDVDDAREDEPSLSARLPSSPSAHRQTSKKRQLLLGEYAKPEPGPPAGDEIPFPDPEETPAADGPDPGPASVADELATDDDPETPIEDTVQPPPDEPRSLVESLEEAERFELENFRDSDIYESLEDVDDLDAFEKAQQLKISEPSHHQRPRDRLKMPKSGSPQFPPPQRIEQPDPSPAAGGVNPVATAMLPATGSSPPLGRSRGEVEPDGPPPPREASSVQSAMPAPASRRPKIGAVHGPSLSSLLRIPESDAAGAPHDISRDRRTGVSRGDLEPALALPVSDAGDEDIEPKPVSSRQQRRDPPMNRGFLPTLIIAEVPRLRRFAAAMIGDEGAADLLVQDTIQQAMAEPDGLRADRELYISLLMILFRLRSEVVKRLDPSPESSMSRSFNDLLFHRVRGADCDEMKEFAHAIGRIGEEHRAILLLSALENLDYRDVAAVIKAPAGRIMSKIAQAREQLAQALATDPGEADHQRYHANQGVG